jgi:hypothetical protein
MEKERMSDLNIRSRAMTAGVERTPNRAMLRAVGFTGGDTYPVEMPEATRRSLVAGTWDSMAALLAGDEAIGAAAARIPYLQWRRSA